MEDDTVIFDTDVFIWTQRGDEKAANIINKADERIISVQTYMELLQCAKSAKQHQIIRNMLNDFSFDIYPITENISHRAAIYIEHYAISNGVRAGDALIAATAVENNLALCTSNKKHFKPIPNLTIKSFSPS